MNDMKPPCSQQQADPEGLLRLCLPNEIGPTIFGPLLAQFAMRYPNIEVSCVVSLAGADALKEDIDIAVAIVRGKMDDASYIARPLATFPCCVVAAPSLLEKCGQPVRCEQLASLPCITTVSALKGQAWQFITARNVFKKVNVQAHFRVNSGKIALHAAVAGVGFAILAEQACRPFIASGQLKVIEWSYRRRRYISWRCIANAIFYPPDLASGSISCNNILPPIKCAAFR